MFRNNRCLQCPLSGLDKTLHKSLNSPALPSSDPPCTLKPSDFMKCESDPISALSKKKHIQSSGTRIIEVIFHRECDPCVLTSHDLLENPGSDTESHIPSATPGGGGGDERTKMKRNWKTI